MFSPQNNSKGENQLDKEQLQELYSKEDYYWGKEPNKLASRLLEYIPESQRVGKKLLDLGAGEGRDSVFFAQKGFNVTAFDFAPAGLEKAHRLATEQNVEISTLEGDINHLSLDDTVDVIYSIGTLQYIAPEYRTRQFNHFKENTHEAGIHVLFTFVKHPDVPIAPDWGTNEFLFERDELVGYYPDWECLYTTEFIFDCESSGVPHQHAAQIVIVKKV